MLRNLRQSPEVCFSPPGSARRCRGQVPVASVLPTRRFRRSVSAVGTIAGLSGLSPRLFRGGRPYPALAIVPSAPLPSQSGYGLPYSRESGNPYSRGPRVQAKSCGGSAIHRQNASPPYPRGWHQNRLGRVWGTRPARASRSRNWQERPGSGLRRNRPAESGAASARRR